MQFANCLCGMHCRAAKLAEKINSLLKYYQNLNLKGINSVKKQYEQKFISLYVVADLRYTVHICIF